MPNASQRRKYGGRATAVFATAVDANSWRLLRLCADLPLSERGFVACCHEFGAPACHDLTVPMSDRPRPSFEIEEPDRMKIVPLETETVLPIDLVRQRVPGEPAYRHP